MILSQAYAKLDAVDCQIPNIDPFDIDKMPEPFNKPDLVVFQECYRKWYIKIGKQLEKKNIPYIIIPHGELGKEAQQSKHLKKVLANLVFFNRFTDKALGIQCLSQRLRQEEDNRHKRRIDPGIEKDVLPQDRLEARIRRSS